MKTFLGWLHRSHWAVYFSAWVLGLVTVGAVLGAILFPLGGIIIGAERTSGALFVRGLRFGSFYFLIWAPAIGLTASVMRAYRRKHPGAESS